MVKGILSVVDATAMITKPMLAGKVIDTEKLLDFYPMYTTPKLDGIRCLVINGHAVTRKFKLVPNKFIRAKIESVCLDGFDGEIMSGKKNFNQLQSLVMSEEGEPEFQYCVFDYVKDDLKKGYLKRMADLSLWSDENDSPDFIKFIFPSICPNEEYLMRMHNEYVKAGYEGIMLRTTDGPYKCGRSTEREGYLLKLKKFDDSECEVLDMEQLMHNTNKAEKDELGHTKRSRKKEGLVATDKLGAFLVKDLKTGIEFKVSTGMIDDERKSYWKQRSTLIGKLIKYKYQGVGTNKRPRFPVFLGFRDKIDL